MTEIAVTIFTITALVAVLATVGAVTYFTLSMRRMNEIERQERRMEQICRASRMHELGGDKYAAAVDALRALAEEVPGTIICAESGEERKYARHKIINHACWCALIEANKKETT